MAMLALLLLVVSLVGLFFSTTLHVLCASAFLLVVIAHNWTSRGFYTKFLAAQTTGRSRTELFLIVLLGLACLLLLLSGTLMLTGVMTPWMLAPWLWLHRGATVLLVILTLWHMKKEWG